MKNTTKLAACGLLLAASCQLPATSFAEEKNWNAQGDGTAWTDDANWLPAAAPTVSDDAVVNLKDASVDISQSFNLGYLTIGGKQTSTVKVSNFTEANVVPGNVTDNAILNRRDGNLTLKGSAGTITLKGTYKDSEEIIPDEPSFMLYVK